MLMNVNAYASQESDAVIVRTTGRSEVSEKCQVLINEFRTSGLKTFESLVALGKIVLKAKLDLSTSEYKHFCKQVGFKPDSPTLRKFECIGRNAPKLEAFGDRMPARWTTLYLIASLTPEQLDRLVSHESFGRDIRAEMVRQIVFPRPKRESKESGLTITELLNHPIEPDNLESISIPFLHVAEAEKKQLLNEIEELQRRYSFSFFADLKNGVTVWRKPNEPPTEETTTVPDA